MVITFDRTEKFVDELTALCERHGAILFTHENSPHVVFGPQDMVSTYALWLQTASFFEKEGYKDFLNG